jgi:hypothetical protein
MSSYRVSALGAAAIMVTLIGCASGDLTLPDQAQPGQAQPASLVVVSGDGQRGEAGSVLENPVTVRVLDDSAHPVANAAVHFSFLGDFSGATLDPPSVLTDEAGRAAATVRLGELVGEQVVLAEVANTQLPDLRALFTAVAVAPGDGDGGKKDGKGHGGDSHDDD